MDLDPVQRYLLEKRQYEKRGEKMPNQAYRSGHALGWWLRENLGKRPAEQSPPAPKTLADHLGEPPTTLEQAVWDALDGVAMKKEPLAAKVADGDDRRLYGESGPLTKFKAKGLVVNKRSLGYYRPDAPPKDRQSPAN